MFDLSFLGPLDPDPEQPDLRLLLGRITLGAFVEEFVSPLSVWQADDYETQWLAAARRLLADSIRVGFVTSYAHPSADHLWWPAWRDGRTVYVHNELYCPDQRGMFSPNIPDQHVRDRVTVSAEGAAISEWVVSLDDIAAFVKRREVSLPAAT